MIRANKLVPKFKIAHSSGKSFVVVTNDHIRSISMYLLLFIFLIMAIQANSQDRLNENQYVLVKSNARLVIVNFFDMKEHILDEIFDFNLCGYRLELDTITVFLESAGQVYIRNYAFKFNYNDLLQDIYVTKNNLRALYFHSMNPYAEYVYKNLTIKSKNGLILYFLKDTTTILEVYYNASSFGGIGISGVGYQNPQFSRDGRFVLLEARKPFSPKDRKVIEVDLVSKKLNTISTKGVSPSYSPDNNIILFYSINNSRVYTFNKSSKETRAYLGWDKALWIYK